VIASFARGLSVRDVEAALAKALDDQAAISWSTVSAIRGQIKDEHQTRARRRLDGVKLDYLFLDASFFRMHPGSPAEPVLAAWGITTDGKPAFIGLAPGTGESFDAWKDFLSDLRDRGLASPVAHRQRRRGRADGRDQAGLPEGATVRDAVLIPDLGAKATAGGDVETVFLRPRPDFRCRDGSGFGWARRRWGGHLGAGKQRDLTPSAPGHGRSVRRRAGRRARSVLPSPGSYGHVRSREPHHR